MQCLDDVTGDPVRLSAAQRERQREQMVTVINDQTKQINALTRVVNGLLTIRRTESESFLLRVRWLFTGR